MPGCIVSSTAGFLGGRPAAPALHRGDHFNPRRRGFCRDIVVLIGECLCLIELCYLSDQNGVRSTPSYWIDPPARRTISFGFYAICNRLGCYITRWRRLRQPTDR